MKTGNTPLDRRPRTRPDRPQWSPVMKTGNTPTGLGPCAGIHVASMEPGHEDREYHSILWSIAVSRRPQWSPVMKTGNTPGLRVARATRVAPQWSPVMKTGNTLMETAPAAGIDVPQWSPVMKTGNTR